MKTRLVSQGAAALVGIMALSSTAYAQAAWTPGTEIVGQPIQVTTNGTTNTLYLDQGGTARIVTPNSNVVPGTWQAANGQLCLSASGAQECWPYNAPFQPGQAQTLTSSCNATSSFLAQSTNQANQRVRGERGQ
jgi:hypothetical protein